mmetsp:Transcript_15727/g.39150  ORF Transcript_15727/g.39150 Transcript_15727/m.39150 type:complete len:123 (-) Transcript_15727:262-630(-)
MKNLMMMMMTKRMNGCLSHVIPGTDLDPTVLAISPSTTHCNPGEDVSHDLTADPPDLGPGLLPCDTGSVSGDGTGQHYRQQSTEYTADDVVDDQHCYPVAVLFLTLILSFPNRLTVQTCRLR